MKMVLVLSFYPQSLPQSRFLEINKLTFTTFFCTIYIVQVIVNHEERRPYVLEF